MRAKIILTALLVGLLSLAASAQVEFPAIAFTDFDLYVTGINVWNLSASDDLTQASGWEFYMEYDAENIVIETVVETTNHHSINMYPNTHAYTNDSQFATGPVGDPDFDGTKKFQQLLTYQHEVTQQDDRMFMDFDVTFHNLDTNRYSVYATFGMIDTNYDIPPLVSGYVAKTIPIPTNGTYHLDSSSLGGFLGMVAQGAFVLYGRNANPADTNDYGSGYVNLNITNLNVQLTEDNEAPLPDPPNWTDAYPISDRAIQCVASNSTDDKFDVEYNFENRTQGYASGWQLSTNWLDQGAASDATGTLSVVNADFESGSTGYQYSTNTTGCASGVSMADDSGNGVAYAYVNGSDGGEGGFALVTQTIDLTDEPLSAGDTVTFSADMKAVTTNQNFGGSLLKLEAYDVVGTLLGSKEVAFTNVTTTWGTNSISYKLPAETEEVLLAVGVTTGWAVTNDADSHYYFDNLEISGVYTEYAGLPAGGIRINYYLWTRDTSGSTNLTVGSRYKRVYTAALDTTAPTPATMSITNSDASATIVKLEASEASDASAVEYYFECTSGPGNNSGWQDSPVYYDRGLTPGTNYSYTVIARDTSHAQNSNTVSAATNITTIAAHTTVGFTNDLKGYTGDTSTLDGDIMVEKDGLETASSGSSAIIEFDGSGATFGAGLDGTGRDLLKTTATGYGDWNVTAYATFAMPATEDESAYIGIGTGLQTGEAPNWGIPELAMDGGYGVVAELKDLSAGDPNNTNCTVRAIFNGVVNEFTNTLAVVSNDIVRAKMVYSAEDKTVSFSIDTNYTGGAFVEDQFLGTVSTVDGFGANVLAGGVVSVYVGGGEGNLVSDFEVSIEEPVLQEEQPPYDIDNPTMGPSGMVFEWTGVATRTYDVLYKTNLLTDTGWKTNQTMEGVDATMSVTGTVDGTSVFYKLLSR